MEEGLEFGQVKEVELGLREGRVGGENRSEMGEGKY